jgi:hypothetical protein
MRPPMLKAWRNSVTLPAASRGCRGTIGERSTAIPANGPGNPQTQTISIIFPARAVIELRTASAAEGTTRPPAYIRSLPRRLRQPRQGGNARGADLVPFQAVYYQA